MIRRLTLWLAIVLFIGIIGYQLFGPIPIGLADNGDFPRILGSLRLSPGPADNGHRFFINDYIVGKRWNSGIPSSEWLVAALAKRIARVVLPAGTFKLQLIGLLHAAILSVAFIILLTALRTRAWWVQLLCGFFLLFIWTDLEYVQQLSTAYTDAGAVVALVSHSQWPSNASSCPPPGPGRSGSLLRVASSSPPRSST